jgi:hypothetical protein
MPVSATVRASIDDIVHYITKGDTERNPSKPITDYNKNFLMYVAGDYTNPKLKLTFKEIVSRATSSDAYALGELSLPDLPYDDPFDPEQRKAAYGLSYQGRYQHIVRCKANHRIIIGDPKQPKDIKLVRFEDKFDKPDLRPPQVELKRAAPESASQHGPLKKHASSKAKLSANQMTSTSLKLIDHCTGQPAIGLSPPRRVSLRSKEQRQYRPIQPYAHAASSASSMPTLRQTSASSMPILRQNTTVSNAYEQFTETDHERKQIGESIKIHPDNFHSE